MAPFSYQWLTPTPGAHTLTATAHNSIGLTVSTNLAIQVTGAELVNWTIVDPTTSGDSAQARTKNAFNISAMEELVRLPKHYPDTR